LRLHQPIRTLRTLDVGERLDVLDALAEEKASGGSGFAALATANIEAGQVEIAKAFDIAISGRFQAACT